MIIREGLKKAPFVVIYYWGVGGRSLKWPTNEKKMELNKKKKRGFRFVDGGEPKVLLEFLAGIKRNFFLPFTTANKGTMEQ